jgi:hypothetical protein
VSKPTKSHMEAVETPVGRDEGELVLAWRIEALLAAGYPDGLAFQLAATPEVDLHAARELIARGCPTETAARILL